MSVKTPFQFLKSLVFDPWRRTEGAVRPDDSVLKAGAGETGPGTVDLDQMLENIERAEAAWMTVRDALEEKFQNWEINDQNADIPRQTGSALSQIDPVESRDGTRITYPLYVRMIRRELYAWELDPGAFAAAQTGDPIADGERARAVHLRALARADHGVS